MPGPGMNSLVKKKKQAYLVIESGYLFRYGSRKTRLLKAKVYQLEQQVTSDGDEVWGGGQFRHQRNCRW